MAQALEALHQSNLIHRDIKPANIIFVNGHPKLADIGLVTDMPREGKDVTFVGTQGYISPEGPGTPAADIFSLGKVLYESLTGLDLDPFPSLPTSALESRDPLFVGLNRVRIKACENNPAERYRTAREMREDLESLKPASQDSR